MKDYLQTVTGPVAREDMGLTLPHEHLFNDLSSVVDAPCYPFSQRLVDKKVTAEIQWALKHDPYCCADNMDRKPIEDVIFEINNFISLGGRTIVDATGSESIGRDAQALTGCITLPTAPVSEACSAMQMRTTWTRPFRC